MTDDEFAFLLRTAHTKAAELEQAFARLRALHAGHPSVTEPEDDFRDRIADADMRGQYAQELAAMAKARRTDTNGRLRYAELRDATAHNYPAEADTGGAA